MMTPYNRSHSLTSLPLFKIVSLCTGLLRCVALEDILFSAFRSSTTHAISSNQVHRMKPLRKLSSSSYKAACRLPYFEKKKTTSLKQMLNSDDSSGFLHHTALAQVLANQYNIDLSSVEPLRIDTNAKITSADVEYHAYKMSQPPCTPQALELAYSYGLDLNNLYDHYADEEDEKGPYFLKMSDVQLYKDHLRSLRASSQKVIGRSDVQAVVRKKRKKMTKLEERMERNMARLSTRALQVVQSVTDNVAWTVQSQSFIPLLSDAVSAMKRSDIIFESVDDFDRELAGEIQAALLSALVSDGDNTDDTSQPTFPTKENSDDLVRNTQGLFFADLIEPRLKSSVV